MTRKDFHFDFDEDADPVEELHRLRVATARHFKTLEALMKYHNSVPPIEEIKARLRAEIAGKKAKQPGPRPEKAPAPSPKPKTAKKPAKPRKTAKRLTHV